MTNHFTGKPLNHEPVEVPGELVPYVGLACRLAISELKARANLSRTELAVAREEGNVPKAILMGIEGSANQADELRAVLVQYLAELPPALRPRPDLLTMPGTEEDTK
ncbi:hypothetical protein [Streptomyces sp. NPDC002644]